MPGTGRGDKESRFPDNQGQTLPFGTRHVPGTGSYGFLPLSGSMSPLTWIFPPASMSRHVPLPFSVA